VRARSASGAEPARAGTDASDPRRRSARCGHPINSGVMNDTALAKLAARVGRGLRRAGLKVVTAESCTAGWIAKALTDVPGSSEWLDSGYVTYSNEAKVRALGVSPRTLDRFGAVSAEAVREMALGALRASGVDAAVAVSGIAGPDGGTPEKPVGTVWLCAALRCRRGARGNSARTQSVHRAGVRAGVSAELIAAMRAERVVDRRVERIERMRVERITVREQFRGDREAVRRKSVAGALRLLAGLLAPRRTARSAANPGRHARATRPDVPKSATLTGTLPRRKASGRLVR